MSEYVEIFPESTADPDVMRLVSNLNLTPDGEAEIYASPEEGDEGSTLAQTLFGIPGLAALTLDGSELLVTRQPGVEWHDLIEDITDALRDFYL